MRSIALADWKVMPAQEGDRTYWHWKYDAIEVVVEEGVNPVSMYLVLTLTDFDYVEDIHMFADGMVEATFYDGDGDITPWVGAIYRTVGGYLHYIKTSLKEEYKEIPDDHIRRPSPEWSPFYSRADELAWMFYINK